MQSIGPTISEVRAAVSQAGLRLLGVTNFSKLTEEKKKLEEWQAAGFFGSMQYMARDADLLTDPSRLLPGGACIISVAMDYGSVQAILPRRGQGRIARYAWGIDYHEVFRKELLLIAELFSHFGSSRSFTDAIPLLERAVANKTGSGFIGKNTLFIQRKIGSFFFLGEILCGFPIHDDDSRAPEQSLKVLSPDFRGDTSNLDCKSCVRCLTACPTGALDTPYTVNAPLCISYLTIEHKGFFNEQQIGMVNDWLFGCDICQEVCPFNHPALKENRPAHRSLLSAMADARPVMSLDLLFAFPSDEAYRKYFSGSAMLRAKRHGLVRNACAVALNQSYLPPINYLQDRLSDSNNSIRQVVAQFILLFEKKVNQTTSLKAQAQAILEI